MCGIAGVINSPSTSPTHVEAMLDCMRYRGPDGKGIESLKGAILGSVRLAVVDPNHAHQPMTDMGGEIWVTLNGEIYNYVELREELEAKGYKFKTHSDTEVLANLWHAQGEAMLPRLIGMYAFCIWDTRKNHGILARDRQGIKPCFVADYKGGTAFCSEIKGLLALPDMPRDINPAGLKDMFAFNYCPPPQTCFKGITHLQPGGYLWFEGNKPPVQKRYWDWPFSEERITPSFDEFEALLDDAVRLQMRYDVKGGMYLSGGVDSSAVAWHLKKRWAENTLPAFGLHFPVEGYSEFIYSEQVAKLLDIDLQEAIIQPDMIPEIAEKVSWHTEQPHGDFSFFLFYLLSQKARSSGLTVMFTGDGPDETMGGQHLHNQPGAGFTLQDYAKTICYMDDEKRALLLNNDFMKNTPEPFERLSELVSPYSDLKLVEQIGAYEATSLLPGNNLVKGDRMGSAWSTENRSPTLDHRVSETFVRLPADQKFRDGFSKYYFKKYIATKLPEELIFKKKSMPTLPIGEWIKSELYGWAHDTLSRHDGTFINTKAALALLDEHKSGTHNHTSALRTLIMSQLWLEQCVRINPGQKAA